METGLAARFVSEENLARAERVCRVSAESGLSPAAVALAYLTCNPLDAYAVIGCSHMAQLEDSLSAADAVLDPAVLLG